MPAFYAHYRFGKEVAALAQGSLMEIIGAHRKAFETGLQGPDIFFFYRPLTGGGEIAKYGHHLHEVSARDFFGSALTVIEHFGRESKEYAYLLGVVCHFVLDGACHPYIADYIKASGVHHLEIEEEFEKFLLALDGEDPVGYPMAELVCTDKEAYQSPVPFYQNMTEKTVRQTLLDLKRVKQLFTAPGAFKQGVINSAMKLTGHAASIKGLMNQRKDNPKCRKSNEELMRLFDEAVSSAVEMMESFDESLTCGLALDSRFDRNYL